MNNVKSFGAKADGKTPDTAVIQRVFDMGGEIFFPPGRYVTATVRLRSGTTLRFAPGAELFADPDWKHFREAEYDPESRYEGNENAYSYGEDDGRQYGLLYAYEAENIHILGGRIFSDASSYCEDVPGNAAVTDEESIYAPGYFRQPSTWRKPIRPRPKLLFFQRCREIRIDGMEILNAPCYSGWFLNCENVTVTGMVIRNDYAQPNADGLHFSSCRHVRVSDCDFVCGDDCIAVDCTYGKPSEDILVEYCVLETSIHAVRVYSGLDLTKIYGRKNSSYVKNVTIRNCRIRETCGLLLVNACDGDISGIRFSDIVADQSFPGTCICLTADEGKISDVCLERVHFRGNGIGYLYAEKAGEISEVRITNCNFEIVPKPKYWGDDYDGMIAHSYSLPYGLLMRNVSRIKLEHTNICMSPVDVSEYTEDELRKVCDEVGIDKFEKILAPVKQSVRTVNCNEINFRDLNIFSKTEKAEIHE